MFCVLLVSYVLMAARPLPVSRARRRRPPRLRLLAPQHRPAFDHLYPGPGTCRPADRLSSQPFLPQDGPADRHRHLLRSHRAHHRRRGIRQHAPLSGRARHRHVDAGDLHVRAGRELFLRQPRRGHRLGQFLLRHWRLPRSVPRRHAQNQLRHLACSDARFRRVRLRDDRGDRRHGAPVVQRNGARLENAGRHRWRLQRWRIATPSS